MVFSFSPANREILEQVVREPRFQQLTQLPMLPPMEIALAVGAFAFFAGGTWLYLASHIPFIAMLLINSFAIYASFTPLHDATHRSVSSHRHINDLIGTISCLLLLPGITTRIYRYLHLEHHRYAGDPKRDPDEPFVSSSIYVLPFILAGLDVHWTWWYIKHWQSRPRSERVEFVLGIAFYIGLHLGFLLSPYALEFFLCFMIPQRLGLFYVSWFFAHIQHPNGVEWESAPFQTTVRIETGTLGHWLMFGQSFHCLHHLAPSIPYYRYQRAWRLGEHLFEQQSIPTRTLWRPTQNLRLPESQNEHWLSARVSKVESVANNVLAFDLVPADGSSWPQFQAGAHIDLRLSDKLIRQYSLCNSPADEQLYRLAVKRDPDGFGGSELMHTDIELGSVLEISAPRCNFPLHSEFEHSVLIAGGIGITPLLAMAHQLHSDARSFELKIFASQEKDVAFHSSLVDLPFTASIELHYGISATDAQSALAEILGRFHQGHGLYLCGPSGFMAEVVKAAGDQSWPSKNIFSETFVPAKVDASENQAFEVEIASTGELIPVAENEFLIDVLHSHGYAVMCSCTQGICGSCVTRVLEGTPEHRDAILSAEQRSENAVMTVCVSRSRSARLVLDL